MGTRRTAMVKVDGVVPIEIRPSGHTICIAIPELKGGLDCNAG